MPDDGCCWSRTVPPCYCHVMSSSSAIVSPVTAITPVIDAHEPSEFQTWLAEQQEEAAEPGDSLAQKGQQIFTEQCVSCHAIQGLTESPRNVGPDLTHFASRETFAGAMFPLNEDNLAAWIEDPRAVKPGALMPDYNLSQEEIDAVVEYLMGLE